MNVSVERLRIWLLVGAGLLVIVIASFLGYAHYRAHRFLTNLPKKLGVNVRRETNGFTYSQSVQGRTIYTVHAAKAVERADGKVTLHDVGIVLYGRKEDRADRIYGKEFEYDQKNQVIRADGEVHIDLQAPEAADANAKMDYAAGKDLHGAGATESKDVRLIHVTTSGLVFLQKLGVAATDNEIEFESGGLTGHAVGADYSSDTGVVVLHSAVRVNGLEHDRPVVLTASRAELDRQNQRAVLTQAKYVAVGGKGGAGPTAQARNVVVHLRPDGTAERIEAEGEVTLANGLGGTVVAPRGEMTLNAQNQPQSAVMQGGVRYSSDEPLRQAKGEASEARAVFDKAGRPEHVVTKGAVHLNERVRTDASVEAWGERELNAGQMEVALSADRAGRAQLRDAKATGDARLKVANPAAKGGGPTSSALAGDVLTAHFVRVGSADHLAEVHGDGHTAMRRVNGKGVVDTSSGDLLVAHFRPVSAGAASGASATGKGQGADEITSAIEQGHVVMTQLPVKKPGDSAAPAEERVTAERAAYDGELERTTLTGNVQVSNGTSVLWADRVVTEQQTGDATADGSVKASFSQVGSEAEPVHVLASRAEMKHDSQVAKFYGAGSNGKPARLWQGASQVDAPVIEFEQKQKRLLAHGEGQGAPGAVHTVLVSGGTAVKADSVKTGKQMGGGKTSVVRVISRELVYSDEARKADFTGGVQVDNADGSMRGQQAVVYLQAAPTNGVKKADGVGGGFMGGNVERVVASGHIEMQQPGRRASGEQLVYTASDGMFVLTGSPTVLPKVVDDQRGTVTGTSLRFHSGDENVVVSNEGESGAGQRVRTETRVKNKE
ncbi:LptA/OstA family protein [Tunturiibacter gelidoferens]|uniref:Lipopolysaccharide export system protein LptA n=1 Tax=Tunturiibacter gelidiferens TaxID=3069689 RepID=A0ACC5NYK0_9BACT|nr:LptA/OstA family protein [Edaphobacter lichenicola]MBB5339660.1 lipopolysaccharide export system protein LptA [Edaphobacter lichenicola]